MGISGAKFLVPNLPIRKKPSLMKVWEVISELNDGKPLGICSILGELLQAD